MFTLLEAIRVQRRMPQALRPNSGRAFGRMRKLQLLFTCCLGDVFKIMICTHAYGLGGIALLRGGRERERETEIESAGGGGGRAREGLRTAVKHIEALRTVLAKGGRVAEPPGWR